MKWENRETYMAAVYEFRQPNRSKHFKCQTQSTILLTRHSVLNTLFGRLPIMHSTFKWFLYKKECLPIGLTVPKKLGELLLDCVAAKKWKKGPKEPFASTKDPVASVHEAKYNPVRSQRLGTDKNGFHIGFSEIILIHTSTCSANYHLMKKRATAFSFVVRLR